MLGVLNIANTLALVALYLQGAFSPSVAYLNQNIATPTIDCAARVASTSYTWFVKSPLSLPAPPAPPQVASSVVAIALPQYQYGPQPFTNSNLHWATSSSPITDIFWAIPTPTTAATTASLALSIFHAIIQDSSSPSPSAQAQELALWHPDNSHSDNSHPHNSHGRTLQFLQFLRHLLQLTMGAILLLVLSHALRPHVPCVVVRRFDGRWQIDIVFVNTGTAAPQEAAVIPIEEIAVEDENAEEEPAAEGEMDDPAAVPDEAEVAAAEEAGPIDGEELDEEPVIEEVDEAALEDAAEQEPAAEGEVEAAAEGELAALEEPATVQDEVAAQEDVIEEEWQLPVVDDALAAASHDVAIPGSPPCTPKRPHTLNRPFPEPQTPPTPTPLPQTPPRQWLATPAPGTGTVRRWRYLGQVGVRNVVTPLAAALQNAAERLEKWVA
ncbi:hypothetical protein FB45DRAFT_1056337 [Roridomyces roridus]|uniref:Uncharacterized protein n=1 Tax=Roridomyces roridus TaxID=1738132 RepID=A0AAD7C498_9AGAR|nr:hypothetical protein FB45DRAFT_1056337 [Roridomyces roridus]